MDEIEKEFNDPSLSYTKVNIDLEGDIVVPNRKVLLLDADTMAYSICAATEVEDDTGDYLINDQLALWKARDRIQLFLDKTGCRDVELHFTNRSRDNFRYKLAPFYKDNRKTIRTPQGLLTLKQNLCKEYLGFIHSNWEADDMVICKYNLLPEHYILSSVDKDVLNNAEGRHFNYYESTHYSKPMSWVEISKGRAKMFPYFQCIVGDKSDNIAGVPGLGEKRAEKFLNEDMTEIELWRGVVSAYESKGLGLTDALLNMNLVNMNLLKWNRGDFEIKYWTPECIGEKNEPQ